jgi:formate-dependent phosphoribosylglycinamide formyltransferase (GAR transformylase)
MTQNQLIELVKKQHPGATVTEIRAYLNDALDEFCRKSRILTSAFQFTTIASQRYYDLDTKISEVTSVDFDGYDIPRLTGRPEKRDLT